MHGRRRTRAKLEEAAKVAADLFVTFQNKESRLFFVSSTAARLSTRLFYLAACFLFIVAWRFFFWFFFSRRWTCRACLVSLPVNCHEYCTCRLAGYFWFFESLLTPVHPVTPSRAFHAYRVSQQYITSCYNMFIDYCLRIDWRSRPHGSISVINVCLSALFKIYISYPSFIRNPFSTETIMRLFFKSAVRTRLVSWHLTRFQTAGKGRTPRFFGFLPEQPAGEERFLSSRVVSFLKYF